MAHKAAKFAIMSNTSFVFNKDNLPPALSNKDNLPPALSAACKEDYPPLWLNNQSATNFPKKDGSNATI